MRKQTLDIDIVEVNTNQKIVTVIQARIGSSRLPGKVMLPLAGKPLILRMYERVSLSRFAGKIVVAVTTDPSDDELFKLCKKNNLEIYRGNTQDLLDRHYQAAKLFNPEAVVKIPSDCPLIDPKIIDGVIGYYLENKDKFDFVSNLHPATFPDGNDVEIMSFKTLENVWINAKKDFEREHTTPYIWENPEQFRLGNYTCKNRLDYSMKLRFTIDYKEDYEFIKRVYDELYEKNNQFGLDEILELLERKPEIKKINQMYAGVNWYRNHINELKTITAEQTKNI